MSKCKAVLDGEKITEIRVKAKAQENSQKDKPEQKRSTKSERVSTTEQES